MAHYTVIARINAGDGKLPFVNVLHPVLPPPVLASESHKPREITSGAASRNHARLSWSIARLPTPTFSELFVLCEQMYIFEQCTSRVPAQRRIHHGERTRCIVDALCAHADPVWSVCLACVHRAELVFASRMGKESCALGAIHGSLS